jgi:hypothetical protein
MHIETGRAAPKFTMAYDWVALIPGLSHQAKALYWHLAMHVNIESGSRSVWPSRQTLAELMGFSRPQSVDKYLDELHAVGAITIVREQHRDDGGLDSHTYLVHQMPPEGHEGAVTLDEFYKRRKTARKEGTTKRAETRRTAGGTPMRSGVQGSSRNASKSAQKGAKSGEQQVDPLYARAHRPPVRSGVQPPVRSGAHELDVENQTNNNPPPTPRAEPAASVVPQPRKGGESFDDNLNPIAEMDALVAEVVAVRNTWSATAVRSALAAPSVTVRDPEVVRRAILILAADRAGTMAPGRLAVDGPWWREAEKIAGRASAPARRDPCDTSGCDPVTRLLFTETGQPLGPCPTCNPTATERTAP